MKLNVDHNKFCDNIMILTAKNNPCIYNEPSSNKKNNGIYGRPLKIEEQYKIVDYRTTVYDTSNMPYNYRMNTDCYSCYSSSNLYFFCVCMLLKPFQ